MSEEGALCIACGMCCSGTIFDSINLDPTETKLMAARGGSLADEGPTAIPFPCPMLEGTCCTIYASRPKLCRSYRCEVLNGLRADKLDHRAALDLIETARKLEGAVLTLLPPDQTIVQARRAWQADPQFWRALPESEREAALRLVMALAALNLHLDRHFRSELKRVIRRD